MSRPTARSLVARLVSEFGYTGPKAELAAGKLVRSADSIWDAFWTWWVTGELPTVEVQGYTVASLMKGHSLPAVAAFLTLDWLMRDPEQAGATLRKGFDRVI